ncbi:FtsX-like permease family protein [Tissierella pigra]|uniref:FtsX-like permease family protein n=1 Tax=Tissierella pigra TaxID=2607614 RepID=A0A6N7XNP9_9FIRM|nr:FtsX-like permease family protein [Tissierella pigra]MBU5427036.1 FtsX-like permease family protein [Tissierella pigra]MSU03126.1 FtsX-like permease family protein [Tissierella pigra]
MKILTEYTLNYLNKNKKNTISIIIVISIAVILLSTMVLIMYMNWNYEVDKAIYNNGNYHGTFKSYINKAQIPYLEENQKVDKVYLKSEYYTGKIDMEKPYINISYMDKGYWDNMKDKNLILEGRIPNNQNEIVVMGNLIKENPSYKIGSKIKINHGHREKDGKDIDVFDFLYEDENFVSEDIREYTIVGIVSGQSLSYEPYYKGLGFLDRKFMNENIKLNVFLRMKNPRSVYKDLPQIGKILGFELGEEVGNEYSYSSRYNSRYLLLQGIYPPSIKIWEEKSNAIFVSSVFIFLIIFMFSIIIYNVFAIWSNNRLRQLGILKSIGATPKQIKRTVKVEAIYLSIIPIILGVGLGHLFCYLFIEKVKSIANSNMDGSIFNMTFKTSPIIIFIILILSFLMILLSISRTAKKLSKISPIEAIKYNGVNYDSFKATKGHNKDYNPAKIIQSLSKDSLKANKKGFRTTIIAIGIGFTILFTFLVVMSGVNADEILNSLKTYYNISIHLNSNEIIDENLFNEISEISEIKENIMYKRSHLLFKIESESESNNFREMGGFKDIDSRKFSVRYVDDYYEVAGEIIGMDHDNFNLYAKSLGQDPEKYYDMENPKAIFLNLVREDMNTPISRTNYIPYLNDNITSLSFGEYGDNGYNYDIDISYKTSEKPWKDFYIVNYNIALIVPKEVLNSMMGEFNLPGHYSHTEYVNLLVDNEDIEQVKDEIKDIAKYYIPESDYYLSDEISYAIEVENSRKVMYLTAFSFVLFMGIIGVSNSYSSINNNLRNRSREFAMLKSMGMTKDGLKKMLKTEGIYYSIYPFIYSIPLCIIILLGIVKTNRLFGIKDFLVYLDYKIMVVYIIIIVMSIYSAYYFGIKRIEKDNIVDILKDESI